MDSYRNEKGKMSVSVKGKKNRTGEKQDERRKKRRKRGRERKKKAER